MPYSVGRGVAVLDFEKELVRDPVDFTIWVELLGLVYDGGCLTRAESEAELLFKVELPLLQGASYGVRPGLCFAALSPEMLSWEVSPAEGGGVVDRLYGSGERTFVGSVARYQLSQCFFICHGH